MVQTRRSLLELSRSVCLIVAIGACALACSRERPTFGEIHTRDANDVNDPGQSDAANIAALLDAMSTVTLSEEDSSLDGSVESAPGSTGESFDASAPHTENEFPPDASSAVDSETSQLGLLRIESVSPPPDAADVIGEATITVTFSADIDTSTAAAFSLTREGVAVPGTAQVSGHTLVFIPDERFSLATRYHAELESDWVQAQGLGSSDLTAWDFTTRDGQWSSVLALDEGSGESKEPSVGITADGTAVAVWSYRSGSYFSVYASAHAPDGEWSAPFLLDEGLDGDAVSSDIATSANGGVYAVWQRQDGDRSYIRMARFVDNMWGSPSTVSDNASCTKSPNYSTTCNASGPQVSVNDSGIALVGWGEVGASFMNSSVLSRRFVPGSSLEAPLPVPGQYDLQLAVDQEGNGLALFTAHGYIGTAFLGAQSVPQWVANTGGELGLLEAQVGSLSGSSVAFDWQGRGHVVWPSSSGIQHWLLTPEDGWGNLSIIGDGEAPVLAAAPNNTVLAAWVSHPAQGALSGATFVDDRWNEPQTIAPVIAGAGEDIQVAVDQVGNGLVLWTQRNDATTEVWWNRYSLGSWGEASKLNTSGQNMERVRVSVSNRGMGVAVWQQAVGSSSRVYARVFE